MEKMMREEAFTKVLVAKHSPQNGCFAQEGQVLAIMSRDSVPQKDHIPHFFVSSDDCRTKSKYGWVKDIAPFTLTSFVDRYLSNCKVSEADLKHVEAMLVSIKHLSEGTPVAATYSSRGVIEKSMKLTVHKVFFDDTD